ncbi:unnamed protein product, partial [Rotaria socialis]
GPPTNCVCAGGRGRGGCTTAGCSVGNDTDCTHGYSYSSGSACACLNHTNYNGTTPFANCAIFGTAVGGISATGATTCCNYFFYLQSYFHILKLLLSIGLPGAPGLPGPAGPSGINLTVLSKLSICSYVIFT